MCDTCIGVCCCVRVCMYVGVYVFVREGKEGGRGGGMRAVYMLGEARANRDFSVNKELLTNCNRSGG